MLCRKFMDGLLMSPMSSWLWTAAMTLLCLCLGVVSLGWTRLCPDRNGIEMVSFLGPRFLEVLEKVQSG